MQVQDSYEFQANTHTHNHTQTHLSLHGSVLFGGTYMQYNMTDWRETSYNLLIDKVHNLYIIVHIVHTKCT